MKTRRFVTMLLIAIFMLSSPLAQSADRVPASTTQSDLDAALAKALAREDGARSEITSLLQREEVRGLAEGYGLDARRAEAAVKTLEGDELEHLSALAADANVKLAGGDQVVQISLVSLLLIIIIIILLTR